MSWLRIDDKFTQHPKVLALTDREFRIHMTALCYSAEYDTGGVIPTAAWRLLGIDRKTAARLTQVGVWDDNDGTFNIHDFRAYNPIDPTSSDRKRAFRERQRNDDGTETERQRNGPHGRAGARGPSPSSFLDPHRSCYDPATAHGEPAKSDDDDLDDLTKLLNQLAANDDDRASALTDPARAIATARHVLADPAIKLKLPYWRTVWETGHYPAQNSPSTPGLAADFARTTPPTWRKLVCQRIDSRAWEYATLADLTNAVHHDNPTIPTTNDDPIINRRWQTELADRTTRQAEFDQLADPEPTGVTQR